MNNVYSQLPARMDDGRNYTIWDPAAVINEKIRQQENIKSNREYRAYLQKNAISIMKINQNQAYQNIGITVPYTKSAPLSGDQPIPPASNLFSF